jgi:hypothetical protein
VALIVASYFVLRSKFVAQGALSRIAVFDRPSGPVWSLFYAVQTIFAPTVDLVYEPRSKAIWLSEERLFAAVAAVVLLVVLLRRYWPAVRREVLFWAGWFVLVALPTANIMVQETSFAERYVLLSHLGVVGLLGVLAKRLWEDPAQRTRITVFSSALLAALAAINIHRGTYYRDK